MLFNVCSIMGCLHFRSKASQQTSTRRTVFDYEIDLYISGQRTLWIDGREYHLEPNTCVIRKPGQEVRATGSSLDSYCLTLDLSRTDRQTNDFSRFNPTAPQERSPDCLLERMPECFPVRNIALATELFSQVIRSHDLGSRYEEKQAWVEKLLLFLASEALSPEPMANAHPQIHSAKQYLLDHLDQNVHIGQLAQQLGFSFGHFIRLFRQECTMTPSEFLLEKRMERARQLLSFEGISVSEAAQRCGYNSFSLFCATFKRKFGISPGQYRKQLHSSILP